MKIVWSERGQMVKLIFEKLIFQNYVEIIFKKSILKQVYGWSQISCVRAYI